MSLKQYFEETNGKSVLSSADKEGRVDAAVYSKPHIMEDGTLAFIMHEKLTYNNLQSNPHAAYLFIEDGKGFKGKRFFLTKVREEKNSDLLFELRKRTHPERGASDQKPLYLVFFTIDKELPLIGAGEDM